MCEKDIDTEDIDHEYTDEIVCPFCGYKFADSWECNSNEEDIGLVDCEECDKSFYATRNVSISYSTEKAEYGTCKSCNSKNVVIEDYRSTIGEYSGLCVRCGAIEKEKLKKEYIEYIQSMSNIKEGD